MTNGWNIGDDGKIYTVDGIDDKLNTSNEDDEGVSIPLFKFKSTCIDDAVSAWLASYGDVNRYNFLTTRPILMDGFVHTAEGYAKSCATSGTCSGNFTDTDRPARHGVLRSGFSELLLLHGLAVRRCPIAGSRRFRARALPTASQPLREARRRAWHSIRATMTTCSPLTVQTSFRNSTLPVCHGRCITPLRMAYCLAGR